jgi:hypothetical protein
MEITAPDANIRLSYEFYPTSYTGYRAKTESEWNRGQQPSSRHAADRLDSGFYP